MRGGVARAAIDGCAPPDALSLFRIWARIGLQSFGGGQAVHLFAYDELVQRREWLSAAEYSRLWGVSQIAPGVYFISFCLVTGRRLAGLSGAAASVFGLLAPSVVLTCVVTSLYVRLQAVPVFHAASHGVVMATAGGSFVMAYRMVRPLFTESMAEGWRVVSAALATLLSAAGLVLAGIPVFAALLFGAALMAAAVWAGGRRTQA